MLEITLTKENKISQLQSRKTADTLNRTDMGLIFKLL